MSGHDRFRPPRRLPSVGWIGGVCAGIAYSLAVPTWLVRLIWTVLTLGGMGSGLLVYILLWIFVPVEPHLPPDYTQRTGDVTMV